jgi:hypothetical protein
MYVFVFCCAPEQIICEKDVGLKKYNSNATQEMIKLALYARSSNLYPFQADTSFQTLLFAFAESGSARLL